ncbi:MAG: NAD(P)-dependent glycerol-3-phosphate dehydrogenase [Verrucomicrobia bacterium]|nr:NAD(P)-dependent glycerol-3-phosphate dehydrogenase [Verrucomicrobiota bacterium]
MKRVGFLGSGAWGITLANLIAQNGHKVLLWSIEEDVLASIKKGRGHPKFPHLNLSPNISVSSELKEILEQDVLVECVTASGFRSVCEKIQESGGLKKPFIITSKGIEQGSGLLLVEVAYSIFGKSQEIGCLSGPTLAKEVMESHPTGAISASPSPVVQELGVLLFDSPNFRVFKDKDILGVALGGAIKNVIAIACGLSEGLGYGFNTRALLITKGLEEMGKLAKAKGANPTTSFGLAGIGDLIVTGVSNLSRNYTFGHLLGKGHSKESAKKEIGAVVEGEYTSLSAHNLAKDYNLELPIINGIYDILYNNEPVKTAFTKLLLEEANCTAT